ncbi:transporter family protein [Halohasta litchfieldiae]|jgi:transporter family protein|uniref:Transporter family protein n=1 Tax=Halohasta litchfieldiae TaxID=1073996 RepID=A0A1H6XLR0_9EURY|nr:EamA family transporter [Halohasta litchfieldiae]ATW86882.1 transporter family protein [Halohasta litchfieldiae]SEJ30019.1 transporter family protein [Halohasta litchfieldiae]
MSYLPWALGALAAYTLVPLLMRVATTGADAIPSDVATVISNSVLVVGALAVIVGTDQRVTPHLSSSKIPYALAAGICLAIGILAYYRALSLGPVSVVTPVFGMFLVTSSIFGMALLDEPVTARKIAGIGFAVFAVYLVTIE